jgi:hypothetical protein
MQHPHIRSEGVTIEKDRITCDHESGCFNAIGVNLATLPATYARDEDQRTRDIAGKAKGVDSTW